jgi:hypothetical protein
VFRNNTAGFGGAIFLKGGIVEQCDFEDNEAIGVTYQGTFYPGRGGAIFGAHLTGLLRHCVFVGNSASLGGAVHAGKGRIEFCVFDGNVATNTGGALIHGTYASRLTVRDCLFAGNHAGVRGGAARLVHYAAMINCDVIGNSAGEDGGGLAIDFASASLKNVLLCNNSASAIDGSFTDLGGNVVAEHCAVTTRHVPAEYPGIQAAIDASIHYDGIVVAPGTYNEAINFGGRRISIRSAEGPVVTIIDASGTGTSAVTAASSEGIGTALHGFTITGGSGTSVGSSTRGGGVFVDTGTLEMDDCIITGNSASRGGGLAVRAEVQDYVIAFGGRVTLINSTISWNEAIAGGAFHTWQLGVIHATDSVFQHNIASGRGGGGELFTSARSSFVDCQFRNNAAPQQAALRTTSTEPGAEAAAIGDTVFCGNHIDNVPGPGLWIDLGGNEFLDDCPAPGSPADLNGDGVVDVLDLLILLDAWGACKDCDDCPADFNGDCSVDVLDLLILLDNWG